MNRKYQYQGYGSDSFAALVQFGFEQLSVHRVVADCNPANNASWKLLKKIGFRREGFLRKKVIIRKDEPGNPLWWDSYAFARLERKIEITLGEEK